MVSVDDLYEVTHGLFKEPIIGSLKGLVQNDMSTAVMCGNRNQM